LRGLQGVALATTVVVAALASRSSQWDIGLTALLLVFAVLAEIGDVSTRRVHLSASFLALVLSAVLLGPAPAVLIAALVMGWDAVQRGGGIHRALPNISIHACFVVLAAIVFRSLDGRALLEARDPDVIGVLIAVYFAANTVNFGLVALNIAVVHGQSPRTSLRRVYLPMLPVELAGALLLVGVAFSYSTYGTWAVALIAVVALVFQRLLKTAVQAADRGEQLELRNQQLAALQVGLISTTMKTLALRDHMTARHSAAVARYARETACALGMSEREQDLVHIAGLFHDIGKFIFPDSILLADRRLTDEEYDIVKRHPEVGADLIAEIDGYGPVAEIVRYHHERIDGRGYPSGLCGDAIPLASRILAVTDVYDVITARDTYRTPVSMREAFAELRRVAGTQLDAHVVEVFIDLVERSGVVFQHSSAADFEAELQLERRVRDYAAPAIAA
jgi:putative nucleotidyltransferase with HDIG domain